VYSSQDSLGPSAAPRPRPSRSRAVTQTLADLFGGSGGRQAPPRDSDHQSQAAGLAMLDAIADARQVKTSVSQAAGPADDTDVAGVVSLGYRLCYGLVVAIGLALAAAFGRFWFSAARLPHDFGRRLDAADILFFCALTFVVWHRLLLDLVAWVMCLRVASYRLAPPPPPGLRVALITTFVPSSESLDMLRRTLAGMIVADYPHDTWVLDEGDDAGARAMCAHLGVHHFSRKGREGYNTDGGTFAAKTKGGNHNAWYAHHGAAYDVVAQIDSDFRVRRDFLTRTLGHFADPRVAFVGTPQVYGNMGNFIARGAAQQTYMFYGPILRALSGRRMTLLIGANHIVRVAALREVGWYQGHLTEDLATGKRFHAARWKSVYVPEALAIGEGPTTWAAYFNQQYRWAFGCMSIFFTHQRVNLKMSFTKGLTYFFLEQFYFSGLRLAVATALLLMYYLTGWTPANLPWQDILIWYVPLLAVRQVIFFLMQRLAVRPRTERGIYWAGNAVSIAVLPIFFLAFVGILRNKRVSFKTTPKGDADTEERDKLSIFAPHMVLAGLALAGVCTGYLLGHRSWVYAGWGLLSVAIYGSFVLSLLWARWRGSVRSA
jgi:cellulose synthase (UDP-forming)